MKHNYVFMIFILSISSSLFCANYIEESYINKKGAVFIKTKSVNVNELAEISFFLNCINKAHQKEEISVYKKGLIRVAIMQPILQTLISATVYDDPKCAERMLNNYVSLEDDRIEYAYLLSNIACGYANQKKLNKAQKLFIQSIEISPFSYSIVYLSNLYASNGHLSAATYWIAQNKKRGFTEEFFIPNAFEAMCDLINKQSNQKTDFKNDIASILQNEEEGLYEPAILETRLKMGTDL